MVTRRKPCFGPLVCAFVGPPNLAVFLSQVGDLPSESFRIGISGTGVAFCASPPGGLSYTPPGGLILYKETRHGPKVLPSLFVLIVLIRAYRSDSFVSSD